MSSDDRTTPTPAGPDAADAGRDHPTEDLMDTLTGTGTRPDDAGHASATDERAARDPHDAHDAHEAHEARDGRDLTTEPTDERRGVRVGTVVWGLVIAAIGLGMLAYALGFTFDVELAVILLVAAAGVALLLGTVLSAARRRR